MVITQALEYCTQPRGTFLAVIIHGMETTYARPRSRPPAERLERFPRVYVSVDDSAFHFCRVDKLMLLL